MLASGTFGADQTTKQHMTNDMENAQTGKCFVCCFSFPSKKSRSSEVVTSIKNGRHDSIAIYETKTRSRFDFGLMLVTTRFSPFFFPPRYVSLGDDNDFALNFERS